MKPLIRVVLILTLTLFTSLQIVVAQAKIWNIQACIQEALQNNIALQNNVLNTENSAISLKQSKYARLPNLNANLGHNFQFGRSIDPSTNQFLQQRIQSTNVGISSSITIFNGFQQNFAIKQNELNYEAGKWDVEKTKNDVILLVTSNYLQVILNQEVLNNARLQEQNTALQVERTSRLVAAGDTPEITLLQIKSQWASDKLSVTRAENQVALSKVALLQAMNRPVSADFEIEKTEIPEPETQTILSSSTEEIYKTALNSQPQIKSAQTRLYSAQMGVKLAKGAYLPRLNAFANVSTFYSSANKQSLIAGTRLQSTGFLANDPTSIVNSVVPNIVFNDYPFLNQIRDKVGEQIGLSLSIPIFNGRQTVSNVERTKINTQIAKNNEQNVKNQLRQTIEQASADLRASSNNYQFAKEALIFNQAAYVNAEKRFDAGLMNTTEFLIQKNNLFVAQINVVQAKYDCFFKLKLLEFYQGKAIAF